jgi:hypothetical protein
MRDGKNMKHPVTTILLFASFAVGSCHQYGNSAGQGGTLFSQHIKPAERWDRFFTIHRFLIDHGFIPAESRETPSPGTFLLTYRPKVNAESATDVSVSINEKDEYLLVSYYINGKTSDQVAEAVKALAATLAPLEQQIKEPNRAVQ